MVSLLHRATIINKYIHMQMHAYFTSTAAKLVHVHEISGLTAPKTDQQESPEAHSLYAKCGSNWFTFCECQFDVSE